MQDAPKAVWSIPYVVSVAFFPNLKQNFIAYCSSKVSYCIFEIHQLWWSGFSRVYSNCCSSCSFEPEILKIGLSSHKMYSNSILNFQLSTAILNACTKKSGNLLNSPHTHTYTHTHIPDRRILLHKVNRFKSLVWFGLILMAYQPSWVIKCLFHSPRRDDKGADTFSKCICPKVNVIVRLKFKLAYTMRTPF